MKTKYILQGGDQSCVLVAFLNFIIARTGKTPIKYKSEKFWKLFRSCRGTDYTGMADYVPALNELKLELVDMPAFNSLDRFKRHLIKMLKDGHLIAFSLYHGENSYHMVLLAGYDEQKKLFKTINGLFYSATNPIEHVKWKYLTKNLFPPKGNPDNHRYFNLKERCSMAAQTCIEETKMIIEKQLVGESLAY